MEKRNITLTGLLLVAVLSMGVNQAYGEIIIDAVLGSGVPGCEDAGGCYTPNIVFAGAGETIIFKNPDSAAHTFTSGNPDTGYDGGFDTSLLMAKASYEWSTNTEGEYPYFCMVHPWMVGTIIVGSGNTQSTSNPEPITIPDTTNTSELQNRINTLESENRALKAEIVQLKDQIILMAGEFTDAIIQLNEWFRANLN